MFADSGALKEELGRVSESVGEIKTWTAVRETMDAKHEAAQTVVMLELAEEGVMLGESQETEGVLQRTALESLVFGDTLSWRWLLPGVPRLGVALLSKETINEKSCRSWTHLAQAIMAGREVLVRCREVVNVCAEGVTQTTNLELGYT